jgi:hypothetical protein
MSRLLLNTKLLNKNRLDIILFNFHSRNLSQLPLPTNKPSSNVKSFNNSNSDRILKKYQLGQTIHKKQVPYWEPPKWIFLGGLFARPLPVAAIGPTMLYFWRFLGASPSNNDNKVWMKNWMKICSFSVICGMFSRMTYSF